MIYAAGVILLSIPVILFVVELALSPCTTGGMLQSIMAIVTFGGIMLWEMESKPMVFKFIIGVGFVIVAWAISQPHIMCSCHLNIWIMFLTHLHNMCLLVKADFKWTFDFMKDVARTNALNE